MIMIPNAATFQDVGPIAAMPVAGGASPALRLSDKSGGFAQLLQGKQQAGDAQAEQTAVMSKPATWAAQRGFFRIAPALSKGQKTGAADTQKAQLPAGNSEAADAPVSTPEQTTVLALSRKLNAEAAAQTAPGATVADGVNALPVADATVFTAASAAGQQAIFGLAGAAQLVLAKVEQGVSLSAYSAGRVAEQKPATVAVQGQAAQNVPSQAEVAAGKQWMVQANAGAAAEKGQELPQTASMQAAAAPGVTQAMQPAQAPTIQPVTTTNGRAQQETGAAITALRPNVAAKQQIEVPAEIVAANGQELSGQQANERQATPAWQQAPRETTARDAVATKMNNAQPGMVQPQATPRQAAVATDAGARVVATAGTQESDRQIFSASGLDQTGAVDTVVGQQGDAGMPAAAVKLPEMPQVAASVQLAEVVSMATTQADQIRQQPAVATATAGQNRPEAAATPAAIERAVQPTEIPAIAVSELATVTAVRESAPAVKNNNTQYQGTAAASGKTAAGSVPAFASPVQGAVQEAPAEHIAAVALKEVEQPVLPQQARQETNPAGAAEAAPSVQAKAVIDTDNGADFSASSPLMASKQSPVSAAAQEPAITVNNAQQQSVAAPNGQTAAGFVPTPFTSVVQGAVKERAVEPAAAAPVKEFVQPVMQQQVRQETAPSVSAAAVPAEQGPVVSSQRFVQPVVQPQARQESTPTGATAAVQESMPAQQGPVVSSQRFVQPVVQPQARQESTPTGATAAVQETMSVQQGPVVSSKGIDRPIVQQARQEATPAGATAAVQETLPVEQGPIVSSKGIEQPVMQQQARQEATPAGVMEVAQHAVPAEHGPVVVPSTGFEEPIVQQARQEVVAAKVPANEQSVVASALSVADQEAGLSRAQSQVTQAANTVPDQAQHQSVAATTAQEQAATVRTQQPAGEETIPAGTREVAQNQAPTAVEAAHLSATTGPSDPVVAQALPTQVLPSPEGATTTSSDRLAERTIVTTAPADEGQKQSAPVVATVEVERLVQAKAVSKIDLEQEPVQTVTPRPTHEQESSAVPQQSVLRSAAEQSEQPVVSTVVLKAQPEVAAAAAAPEQRQNGATAQVFVPAAVGNQTVQAAKPVIGAEKEVSTDLNKAAAPMAVSAESGQAVKSTAGRSNEARQSDVPTGATQTAQREVPASVEKARPIATDSPAAEQGSTQVQAAPAETAAQPTTAGQSVGNGQAIRSTVITAKPDFVATGPARSREQQQVTSTTASGQPAQNPTQVAVALSEEAAPAQAGTSAESGQELFRQPIAQSAARPTPVAPQAAPAQQESGAKNTQQPRAVAAARPGEATSKGFVATQVGGSSFQPAQAVPAAETVSDQPVVQLTAEVAPSPVATSDADSSKAGTQDAGRVSAQAIGTTEGAQKMVLAAGSKAQTPQATDDPEQQPIQVDGAQLQGKGAQSAPEKKDMQTLGNQKQNPAQRAVAEQAGVTPKVAGEEISGTKTAVVAATATAKSVPFQGNSGQEGSDDTGKKGHPEQKAQDAGSDQVQAALNGVQTPVVQEPAQPEAKAVNLKSALHESILSQVKDGTVSHDGKGGRQISIRLNPNDLGELKIQVRMEDNRVNVEVHADNPTVKNLLMSNLDSLKEALSSKNMNMEGFDVSSGGGSFNSQLPEEKRGPQQQPMLRTAKAGGYAGDDEGKVNYLTEDVNNLLDVRF